MFIFRLVKVAERLIRRAIIVHCFGWKISQFGCSLSVTFLADSSFMVQKFLSLIDAVLQYISLFL